jgi:chromosome segregation ATPase
MSAVVQLETLQERRRDLRRRIADRTRERDAALEASDTDAVATLTADIASAQAVVDHLDGKIHAAREEAEEEQRVERLAQLEGEIREAERAYLEAELAKFEAYAAFVEAQHQAAVAGDRVSQLAPAVRSAGGHHDGKPEYFGSDASKIEQIKKRLGVLDGTKS